MRAGNAIARLALASALTTAGASACSDTVPDRAPEGRWGGDHVSLVVSEAGATVELDCAHGTMDEPVRLDREGRFDVDGRYVREGGPVFEGDAADEEPAHFSGSVDGRRMTLRIALEDGTDIGPFTLTLGTEGRLFKCL